MLIDIPLSTGSISDFSEAQNRQQAMENGTMGERDLISPYEESEFFSQGYFDPGGMSRAGTQLPVSRQSTENMYASGMITPLSTGPIASNNTHQRSLKFPDGKDFESLFAPDAKQKSACGCSITIIQQISSLPVLLHADSTAADASLLQFQEAVRLCTTCLGCSCAGHDETSVLSLAMLITRILDVLEGSLSWHKTSWSDDSGQEADQIAEDGEGRGHGRGTSDPEQQARASRHARITRSPAASQVAELPEGLNSYVQPPQLWSPTFSLGQFVLDVDDDRSLKQEMWWLQVKKTQALIAGFRNMVLARGRQAQDLVQTAAWEKLYFLLERNAARVKDLWMVARASE